MIPRDVLIAISKAVHSAGGDMSDVVAVWTRIATDRRGQLDRMRAQAKAIRCCCASGGVVAADGRCERCNGWVDLEAIV